MRVWRSAVKRKRALRIVVTFALVGFAAAWLYSRGREATDNSNAHEDATPVATLDDDNAADVIPGELVVEFKDGESRDQIAALGAKLGVTFEPASSYADRDEVYTVDTGDVEAADYQFVYWLPEDALAAEDEAVPTPERVDPTEKGFPNDPKFKFQWHMDQIHAKDTWKNAQGDGVIVAVIDTGVAKVPDLAQTEIVPGWN